VQVLDNLLTSPPAGITGFVPDGIAIAPDGTVYLDTWLGNGYASKTALRGGLGELRPVGRVEGLHRGQSVRPVLSAPDLRERLLAAGCADFGSAASTFAVLWNQQRPSRASGNTSRSPPQNPSAPSPTASTGARIPRRAQSRSRSAHDSADSRYPSARAISGGDGPRREQSSVSNQMPPGPARTAESGIQVYVRSTTGQRGTAGVGADRPLATANRLIRTHCGLQPWAR
jgi:hypothetical protein